MNNETRTFLTSQLLTIGEIAQLMNLTTLAATKRAERQGWDFIVKGGKKLYWRGDLTSYLPNTDHKQ